MYWGLGVRVSGVYLLMVYWGLGFGVWGLGYICLGCIGVSGFRVYLLMVYWGIAFGVSSLGIRVSGFGLRFLGVLG